VAATDTDRELNLFHQLEQMLSSDKPL